MRPARKIVILWIQLLLWSLVCVFQTDLSIWKHIDKVAGAMRETPLTPFVVLFGLLMFATARYLKATGQDAASLFGADGLESRFASPKSVGWVWLILAMAATAVGLGIAESARRYYFVQDDNFSQFLPGIVYGCREAFAGRFANWDPYQMMGMPLADLGTYALTYPFTYFSFGIAKFLLGDEMRVLDVFCWLHLILGSGAVYLLGRRMRLWGPIAAGVAICFSLSGYSLIAGRSWYYMTPTALWLPLLILLGICFEPARFRWGWTLALGACTGMYYHSGNAQMCFYGLSFMLIVILLRMWKEQWDWRALAVAVPGLLIGVGFSLPLLIPQWKATAGLVRQSFGEGIERGLFSLLLPNPVVNSLIFNKMGSGFDGPSGQFYYAGGLFTFAWLLGIVAICVGNGGLKAFRANPLLSVSVIAFLSALGKNGGLWVLQTKLPVLSGFSQPAKFLPYTHLFTLLIGALFVQSLCSRVEQRRLAAVGVFGLLAALMFHHASIATEAFYLYGDRPDFKLSSGLLNSIGQERLFPAAPQRGPQPEFLTNLLFNVGTLVQVQSIDGYEPLWRSKSPYKDFQNSFVDDYLGTLRTYGVTRILIHDSVIHPIIPKDKSRIPYEVMPAEWTAKLTKFAAERKPLFVGGKAAVYALEGSDPMAKRKSDGASLPVKIESGDVVVNGGGLAGEEIMVNYLWRPGMFAYVQDQPVETRPDKFSRVLVTLPASANLVKLRYEADWGGAIRAGIGFVLFGGLLGGFLQRRSKVAATAQGCDKLVGLDALHQALAPPIL